MRKPPSVSDLTGSVTRAFYSVLQIFAFVLFFSCITSCLSPILAALQLPSGVSTALYGLLEITLGIRHAVTVLTPETAFRFSAFFVGFAGLSVCLQLFSVAEGERLRLSPYLLAKTAQGGLCFLLAEAYLRLFRPQLKITDSVSAFTFSGGRQYTLLVLLLLPVCVLFLSVVQKRKRLPH